MTSPRRSPFRGVLILASGIVLAALLAMHSLVPTTRGLALIVDSMLPWSWVLIALLLLIALFRLSLLSIAGVLIPVVVWASMFWPFLRPSSDPVDPDLTVATQNVGARLPQPSATALSIIEQDPKIVTVQEIESLSGQIIQEQMDSHFAHSQVEGSVGVWSDWPMSEAEEIDLGLSWTRAFATTISTDQGDVRFYAVHLPSVRPGQESLRNAALTTLADRIQNDPAERVIVAGDFNASATDRYFSDLTDDLTDSREATGGGFGFTWPSRFPLTRLDHSLSRGLEPIGDEVQDRGTSDHRALFVSYDF
ncbi:endonuclease/exonuclease/phosphatase family protein [Brevibacterium jeotgali]|uniref:Vancomycin resistance protein VanJ n=1 Tax=Brevibacterium jeotgali TaxID=1262550 RepID=A0A2H1L1U2_9MICO|nr:endonuclease/exonuclease/phosphatase family protein [Brevibacterium jeotgali]TWC01954.1 vancomycin resistance protein VanJ [Brevibacterium jeotgali]SMY10695.1 vancomycin resistance protein VanJ [Brevibacterium jeotgali]